MTRLRPLRTFARLINGHPFSSDDFAGSGDLPVVRIRDLGDAPFTTFISKTLVPSDALVEDGRILIGMDGDFNVRLWNRGPAALNQRVCMLEANPQSDERFLAYALAQPLQTINDLTYATTVKHISGGQILRIMLMDFSFAEQRSIADFLDRETAQIDAMIEAQELVLLLAEERRGAIIAEEIDLLDSKGVPRVQLRHSVKIQTGVTLGKDYGDKGIEFPYLRVANVQTGHLDLDEIKTVEVSAAVAQRTTLQPGDVLITEGGDRAALGRGALWNDEIPGALHQNHIFALRCGENLDPEFLVYALDAPSARIYFEKTRTQTTNLSSTNSAKVRACKIPRPPIEQQREIVRRLKHLLSRIDQTIDAANDVIALLRERREALITAAVTGRIDPETGIEYPENPETPKES